MPCAAPLLACLVTAQAPGVGDPEPAGPTTYRWTVAALRCGSPPQFAEIALPVPLDTAGQRVLEIRPGQGRLLRDPRTGSRAVAVSAAGTGWTSVSATVQALPIAFGVQAPARKKLSDEELAFWDDVLPIEDAHLPTLRAFADEAVADATGPQERIDRLVAAVAAAGEDFRPYATVPWWRGRLVLDPDRSWGMGGLGQRPAVPEPATHRLSVRGPLAVETVALLLRARGEHVRIVCGVTDPWESDPDDRTGSLTDAVRFAPFTPRPVWWLERHTSEAGWTAYRVGAADWHGLPVVVTGRGRTPNAAAGALPFPLPWPATLTPTADGVRHVPLAPWDGRDATDGIDLDGREVTFRSDGPSVRMTLEPQELEPQELEPQELEPQDG